MCRDDADDDSIDSMTTTGLAAAAADRVSALGGCGARARPLLPVAGVRLCVGVGLDRVGGVRKAADERRTVNPRRPAACWVWRDAAAASLAAAARQPRARSKIGLSRMTTGSRSTTRHDVVWAPTEQETDGSTNKALPSIDPRHHRLSDGGRTAGWSRLWGRIDPHDRLLGFARTF